MSKDAVGGGGNAGKETRGGDTAAKIQAGIAERDAAKAKKEQLAAEKARKAEKEAKRLAKLNAEPKKKK